MAETRKREEGSGTTSKENRPDDSQQSQMHAMMQNCCCGDRESAMSGCMSMMKEKFGEKVESSADRSEMKSGCGC